MLKTCLACHQPLTLSPKAKLLLQKFPEEPEPSFCVPCGHKRRLLFRNGRNLYRRKCDFTGEPIISMYAPEKPYTVYKADVWWSDQWDPLSFGRDVDWNRPFFEQWYELQRAVPRLALTNLIPVNSDYCNMTEGNRNCYLIFGGDFNEDCLYGIFGMHNRTCADIDLSNRNELCYFLGDSYHCYNAQFVFDSLNCKDCAFISDCIGCSDCILCTNLVQKSFCIRNQQLTKAEYELQKRQLLTGSFFQQQKLWGEFLSFRSRRIVRYAHILSSDDCTGDYIQGSKTCHNCYDTAESEDLADVCVSYKSKDSLYSSCFGHDSELCYDVQSSVSGYNVRHSVSVFNSSDVEYCDFVFQSNNLFGCVCLKKGAYCILNKQYSKEEYEKTRTKLIEHMKRTEEWGKFFPPSCSPFAYNESTAPSYYPLSKEQAMLEGFSWFEKDERPQEITRSILASELPDDIRDIPDDILHWAIVCQRTKRAFKLTKQELDFYRMQNIPIPRLHPDERYKVRLALRNPITLHERVCSQCGMKVQSTYASQCSETVLCEECYLKKVY